MIGIEPLQSKQDIVIVDELEPCPYLPGQTARMPLRMPLGQLSLEQMDHLLESGNRRTGEFVYQTRCPQCRACLPIRIDCERFLFKPHWRRILNQGNRHFSQSIGPLQRRRDRINLFNKHRRVRGLAPANADIDIEEYHWGFIKTCFDSFEIAYHNASAELVCVAICDHAAQSLSAVYTFYDPDCKDTSVGSYSILKQIEYCLQKKLRYLYLGFFVENSIHMQYKDRFKPQERLIDGHWVTFE